MDKLAHFRCSCCNEVTTFRPGLLEALLQGEAIIGSFQTYQVSCKHCRRHDLLICPRHSAFEFTGSDPVVAGPRVAL